MTRKDRELIAMALRKATPLASDGDEAMRTWHRTVACVIQVVGNDNNAFYEMCCGALSLRAAQQGDKP